MELKVDDDVLANKMEEQDVFELEQVKEVNEHSTKEALEGESESDDALASFVESFRVNSEEVVPNVPGKGEVWFGFVAATNWCSKT